MPAPPSTSRALGALLKLNHPAGLEIVAEALAAERGNVYRACQRLGVPHSTFMRWRQQVPELEAAVTASRSDKTG